MVLVVLFEVDLVVKALVAVVFVVAVGTLVVGLTEISDDSSN